MQSQCFEITPGVRQGCVLVPDSFSTSVDSIMDRATGKGMNGVMFGLDAYTDFDFAFAGNQLLLLLTPVLEAMDDDAAAIRLGVNWD